MSLSRRQLLLGAGALAVGAGAVAVARLWRRDPTVAERVAQLADTKTRDAVALGVGWMAAGATAAAFHAQVLGGLTVGDFHATFTPPAVAMLPLAPQDERLAALWALELAAEWLFADDEPRPVPPPIDHPAGWRGALAELAPDAVRLLDNPHTPIFVAQVGRGLERFGDTHAPELLALLRGGAERRRARPAPLWERALAMRPGDSVDPDRLDDGAVGELLAFLPTGASDALSDELARGFGTDWSLREGWSAAMCGALRLVPALRARSGMGVHAVTMTDACVTLADSLPPVAQWPMLHQVLQTLADLHVLPGVDPAARGLLDVSDAEVEAASRVPGRLVAGAARLSTELHDVKVTAAVLALAPRLGGVWGQRALALAGSLALLEDPPSVWPGREDAHARLAAVGLA